ncbi:hypothetical protein B0H17DRAFT_1125091 [Mycena rosella]|uniref:Endo-chitosanase n=1 Tax=Mycena rosella TaxID=1033263 RepID=A0AAD7MAJ8_MYCRO|nr:hypothetical protein B0H17DRAFT_1125091 [Mycena rosella]
MKETLKPNTLGAIICDGKMFYAIFGDTNGANPQVIGEGSLLLGKACFDNGKTQINGTHGHDPSNVAYTDGLENLKIPKGVGMQMIDLAALKMLGDQQVRLLVLDLNLNPWAHVIEGRSSLGPQWTSKYQGAGRYGWDSPRLWYCPYTLPTYTANSTHNLRVPGQSPMDGEDAELLCGADPDEEGSEVEPLPNIEGGPDSKCIGFDVVHPLAFQEPTDRWLALKIANNGIIIALTLGEKYPGWQTKHALEDA